MSRKAAPTELSSSDFNDDTSSSETRRKKSTKKSTKRDSIKNYVTNLLTKPDTNDGQQVDLTQTQMTIDAKPDTYRNYENISAFQRYQPHTEGTKKSDSQRRQEQSSSSDDEIKDTTPKEQVTEKLQSLN